MNLVRDVRDVNRFRQIVYVLFKNGFEFLLEKAELKKHIPIHKRFETGIEKKYLAPVRFRKVLEELGGSFIKLGQLLSLRPDLVPNEYCEELTKLQDTVKPMSFGTVKAIIESELKQPIETVFRKLEKTPIGSASIAQVHEAVLKDGRRVAVKVQRPNLKTTFETDIDLMYKLAGIFENHSSLKNLSPTRIVREFEEYTKKELIFTNEATNINICYENFKNVKDIKIPKVYFEYCTEKIIVMEFVDGLKLSQFRKGGNLTNRKKVAKTIIAAYFKQTLEDAFFHADLHPGNLLVLENNKVALLDFGIFGAWDDHLKEAALDFLIALVQDDSTNTAKIIFKMCNVSEESQSFPEFRNEAEAIIGGWKTKKLKDYLFSSMLVRVVGICSKYELKIPPNLVLFAKGLLTIEGTCVGLYPEMNFINEIKPHVIRIIKKRKSPYSLVQRFLKATEHWEKFAEELPSKTARLVEKLDKGDIKIGFEVEHKELKQLTTSIDQVGNRIVLGITFAALIIASALVVNIPQEKIYGISLFSFIGFIGAIVVLLIFLWSYVKNRPS